eukprot:scaffold3315_cov113-Skeletonema_marinoi.AAC.6
MVGVSTGDALPSSPASFVKMPEFSIRHQYLPIPAYYSIPYSCQDSISMSHPGYNTPSMLQTGNSSPRFCSMSSWSSHRTLPVDV